MARFGALLMDLSTRPKRQTGTLDAVLLAVGTIAILVSATRCWQVWEALQHAQAVTAPLRGTEPAPRTDELSAQGALSTQAPPGKVLQDLVALLPSDVRVTGMSLNYTSKVDIDFSVEAKRSSSYDVFLERLQASPRFPGLEPGAEHRHGGLSASLKASYRPQP